MKYRAYLNWVKSLDCCYCGAPADDAHHIIGVGNFSGMGMKAPDYLSVPVCRGCHGNLHGNPELWPSQWENIVRTLHSAFLQGRIKYESGD
jgi:hypothetical protein